jgi:hypothetical protein
MPAPFNDITATHTSARRQRRLSHHGTANSDDFRPATFCCRRTALADSRAKRTYCPGFGVRVACNAHGSA